MRINLIRPIAGNIAALIFIRVDVTNDTAEIMITDRIVRCYVGFPLRQRPREVRPVKLVDAVTARDDCIFNGELSDIILNDISCIETKRELVISDFPNVLDPEVDTRGLNVRTIYDIGCDPRDLIG